MIRTILFDLGNVLIHFCHDRMLSQIGAVCGHPAHELRQFLIESGLQWEFERGRITEDEFHRRFEHHTGRALCYDSLLNAAADIFWPNDTIVPVVASLKEAGYRLVVLSNTCVTHFRFVRQRYPALDFFDDYVLSYEVGAIKPEPAIFAAALDKAGCHPSECFYTDDIPLYIETARGLGINAEVFTGTPDLVTHLRQHGIELPT